MQLTEPLQLVSSDEMPIAMGSIDFLIRHFKDAPGYAQLVAIDENGIVEVVHEKCAEVEKLQPFIEKHDAKNNLHFCVSPVREPVLDENGYPKKAAEKDILCMSHLHVDLDPNIDPETGATLESERKRIIEMMEDVEVTALIDSGGGYQAFLKLASPVFIEKENAQEHIAELKSYNIHLRDKYGGDACQDLCRLMRLPGTWNLPNEKKKKQGRQPALATVIRLEEKTFKLSDFDLTKLEPAAVASVNVHQLQDLPIPVDCIELIVTGKHPEKEFSSRSEALFSVLCTLTLAGVDDQTILAICRNPDYKISEKPLEKSEEWLLKEIERATEFVTPEYVSVFNERYFVTVDGNKALVFKEDFDPTLNRRTLTPLRFQELRDFYCNQPVIDYNGKDSTKGKAWLIHPRRRQYEGLVFEPGGAPIIGNRFNLWQGYSVKPASGDFSLFEDHLYQNICRENLDLFNWLWNWMAAAVQRPNKQAEIAIVLRGERGTGKGVFVRLFGQLFGSHFLHIASPKHMVGNFNAHLRNCVVLFADEAFWAGDPQAASRLKALITEPTISIEPKFRDVISVPNMLHILMASNDQWVVPAGNTERRFFVLDVADTRAQDTQYFRELVHQMENEGGSAALLYALLETDLSSWNHRVAPQTDALLEQQLLSMNPVFGFWYQCLNDGGFGPKFPDWTLVGRKYLYHYFREYSSHAGLGRPGTHASFGLRLGRLVPGEKLKRGSEVQWANQHDEYLKERSYDFPPLHDCREYFCRKMGWQGHNWDD